MLLENDSNVLNDENIKKHLWPRFSCHNTKLRDTEEDVYENFQHFLFAVD